jgi:2-hydroxychromene-2-carboxylate isomerase
VNVEVTQHGAAEDGPAGHGAFYFDFASPEAYLAAERVLQVMGGWDLLAEWIPVRARDLPAPDTWEGFRCQADREAALDRVAAVAAARGLQPVRWPETFPLDSELALRAASYAKSIGRVVSFALAAFRQAYAGGHDLADTDVVLIAASACEMHPRAVLQALERDAVVRQLDEATALAAERGVRDVPAVWLPGDRVLHGDAALDGPVA